MELCSHDVRGRRRQHRRQRTLRLWAAAPLARRRPESYRRGAGCGNSGEMVILGADQGCRRSALTSRGVSPKGGDPKGAGLEADQRPTPVA